MPSPNYPYAVGRIRLIENSLFDPQRLARLGELSYVGAVKQLSDWGYAAEYPVRDDVDGMIDFRMREVAAVIDDVSPDIQLTNLFRLPFDAANIKYLIKSRMLETEPRESDLVRGIYDIALLRECVSSRNYSLLGEPLASRIATADGDKHGAAPDPRKLSAMVDKAVYQSIAESLKKHPNALLKRYFSAKIDFTNILSMLRARALRWSNEELSDMLIPAGGISEKALFSSMDTPTEALASRLAEGNEADVIRAVLKDRDEKDIAVITTGFETALLAIVETERYDPFGIGPILSFLLRSEAENRELRMLFARLRVAEQAG